MNFKSYFMRLDTSQRSDFARRCETSKQHLINIAYGKTCGEILAVFIERESSGAVICEDLRPDVSWLRVPDAKWPHPEGRPLVDHAARIAQQERKVA